MVGLPESVPVPLQPGVEGNPTGWAGEVNGRDAPTTIALGDVINNLGESVGQNGVSKDIVHGFERKLIQKQLDNNSDTDSARG